MAARAGVRIVPISIIGTHLFQPPGAFLPFAIPRGVRIICHPPLDVPRRSPAQEELLRLKEEENIFIVVYSIQKLELPATRIQPREYAKRTIVT